MIPNATQCIGLDRLEKISCRGSTKDVIFRNIITTIKSKSTRWVGHLVRVAAVRSAFKILFGIPEGKRPVGKPRRIWEDNFKMNLKEKG
jgi:hypothetical protein